MKFEIKAWAGGGVLFSCETETLKLAIELAVKQGADLQGAYLRGAYLRGADLQGADLWGADLQGADLQGAYLRGAYLRGADLQGADLRGADLRGADLWGAYLQGADLRGADLRGADLWGAYLQGADLRGADLQGASGADPNRITPLRILLEQPGPIRAYKLVTESGHGPFKGGLSEPYAVGQSYAVKDASTDEHVQCAPGINLCTLDWAMREWREGFRILVAEFTAADIAAIPIATDGKFRCRRVTIVAEKDLTALGLVKAGQPKEAA